MKKTVLDYGFYLFFYSVGGFFLERIINILFLGTPYDNSFLYGPYQPLYGFGILLTILVYDYLIKNKIKNQTVHYMTLLLASIFFTGLVETITGEFLEHLTGKVYWNYGLVLPMCTYPYSCIIPTSIFGLIATTVIIFIHPKIEQFRLLLSDRWIILFLAILFIDAVTTIIKYL